MLLQTIMSYWAILILMIGAVCVVSIFVSARASRDIETPVKALFDFSGGQQEGRQMQTALGEALAEAKTDAEFEQSFKRVIHSATGLEAEFAWAWLGRSLMEYRQANEFEPSSRALAERFLSDIPHRYKLKEEPEGIAL